MNLGDKIRASKLVWERKPSDLYPTPPDMTQALLDAINLGNGKPPGRSLCILEPCCGEGHIARVLKANGHHVTARDIDHTGYGTGGMEYLATPELSGTEYEFEAVITNPPFSLAEAIIRRALRDAPIVAMLLSNNYWHAASRSTLFESRPPVLVLAPLWRPAFLAEERGNSPLMNVIWTVWADDPYLIGVSARCGVTHYRLIHRPITFPRAAEVTSSVRLGRTGKLGPLIESIGGALASRLA